MVARMGRGRFYGFKKRMLERTALKASFLEKMRLNSDGARVYPTDNWRYGL